MIEIILIAFLLFIVAFLYSSVGHGGASGYLAILSLFAFPAKEMSSTALLLNIVVSGIALYNFSGAGYLNKKIALPFLLGSIPAALLGGMFPIHQALFDILLAFALLAAALRMILDVQISETDSLRVPKPGIFSLTGAGIGFLSGVVGIGGGVFLSPLLIFFRWANMKQTAAIAAVFIFANSLAGVTGRVISGQMYFENLAPFVVAATLGGWFGSRTAAQRFAPIHMRYLLAVVLFVAAVRGIIRLVIR